MPGEDVEWTGGGVAGGIDRRQGPTVPCQETQHRRQIDSAISTHGSPVIAWCRLLQGNDLDTVIGEARVRNKILDTRTSGLWQSTRPGRRC
jgi:hypothetical protein